MKKHLYIRKKVNENADPTMAASGMVQGNGYGYVYRILPFNKSLEQKPNDNDDERYIHVGCTVAGYELGDVEHTLPKITGRVIAIIRSQEGTGEIEKIKVQPERGGRWKYLEPDGLEIVVNDKPVDTTREPVKMFPASHNIRL